MSARDRRAVLAAIHREVNAVARSKNPLRTRPTAGAVSLQAQRRRQSRFLSGKVEGVGSGSQLTALFDVAQGVTWGGKGCEKIFAIRNPGSVESDLLRKTIGGESIGDGRVEWSKEYLVFPYLPSGLTWEPAFADELDFGRQRDDREVKLGNDLAAILDHRIAAGLPRVSRFPNTARYLLSSYEQLSGREPEGKAFTDSKWWYEYHRPRTPTLLTVPKIVCRRLMKRPSFAIDSQGFLPRDSVQCLIPRWNEAPLKTVGASLASRLAALEGILTQLNSTAVAEYLSRVPSKKSGDFVMVSEGILEGISVQL